MRRHEVGTYRARVALVMSWGRWAYEAAPPTGIPLLLFRAPTREP
jgi:hypothetical protein